ncbi:MAG: hypothetical protein HOV83_41550, partial [Catenulispora sp.]|nr:hypothetical protein [Catenulispora sp.]
MRRFTPSPLHIPRFASQDTAPPGTAEEIAYAGQIVLGDGVREEEALDDEALKQS